MGARRSRAPRRLAALGLLSMLALLLSALGTWQLERRAWKLALIARVDQRIHQAPVAAPGPEQWTQVGAERDEYRHVELSGRLLADRPTLVEASTERGPGWWLMVAIERDDGSRVMVNRGFVPPEARSAALHGATSPGDERVRISGLLRMSEPGGRWPRRNDPGAGRWVSRDVAAIAAARGLGPVAPYFVDADAEPSAGPDDWPVGGLTVVRFRNAHLGYALTWYGLALMTAYFAWRLAREPLPAAGHADG